MLPTLQVKLIALAAALALGFSAGWAVNGWRFEARHASELQAEVDARAKAEQDAARKSAALEDEMAALRRRNNDLNRRTARETNKPAYRCPVPADGVRLRAEAVAGRPAAEHDPAVPAGPATP
jgi:hypothetical protein